MHRVESGRRVAAHPLAEAVKAQGENGRRGRETGSRGAEKKLVTEADVVFFSRNWAEARCTMSFFWESPISSPGPGSLGELAVNDGSPE